MWNWTIWKNALTDSVKKLDPRYQFKNPVMFIVWVCALITTGSLLTHSTRLNSSLWFLITVSVFLWATVWFANLAESVAEGRGKAQANDGIPSDREVIQGVAAVNESALTIILICLSLIFVVGFATLLPVARFLAPDMPNAITVIQLAALLVCLIPTTIGGLLSAIGIAGRDRLVRKNIIAMSGRAIEAAGDVTVLLLDKTGTITHGNRRATDLFPAPDVLPEQLADAAYLASISDETPEGKSTVELAKKLATPTILDGNYSDAEFVPFSAASRMSGVIIGDRDIRKGALDATIKWVTECGGAVPEAAKHQAETIARQGGTPLLVADNGKIMGVIALRDIVKDGIRERFGELRGSGIRTVMITGDNPFTAAAIAAQAGVDDFVAEATPQQKLALIRKLQAEGHIVAMVGDGTDDAPALAQADVAVAMNSGTQAAKEAANMIDLDSDPTKLIDVVQIGKQLLATRGALTTFSLANDIAKYFAIVPAMFTPIFPQLSPLNIMHLGTPETAIASSVIFNAIVIGLLLPIAMRGVTITAQPLVTILRRNLLIYGVGGLIVPFIGIKLIDMLIGM